MLRKKIPALLMFLAVQGTHQALAHDTSVAAVSSTTMTETREPLYDNLGNLTYPITTDSELAQQYFNQGLRWTYAFNHAAALRAFREAQRLDPNCALCYWGEAFVLGPNINVPMNESAGNPAVDAIVKAQELAHHAQSNEQALITALTQRYSTDSETDRTTLDQAYSTAMGKAAAQFPDDQDIAVLYIDSIMNLSPWDYWEADGETPKGKIGEAIAQAEKVLAVNPNHPGAIHMYIHLTEASKSPERAEPYAERIATLMPGASHLVHMGGHTYYRIGRFEDSTEVNKIAVQVDDDYFAKVDDSGVWANGYRPHNIHFAAVSALMAGDTATAFDYAERIEGKIADEVAAQIGWIQLIKQSPYLVHAHLSKPEKILALPDPSDQFPLVKVAWHYARGVAFARQGEVEKARTETAKIADINQNRDISYPPDVEPVVPDILRIAQHVIEGRIAQNQANWDKAIKEFEIAAHIQDALPYLEPPFWYYPVSQSLGAVLLQAGKVAEAEQVFAASLASVPNNGWALYGLLQVQKAQGNKSAMRDTEQHLRQAWVGDLNTLDIQRL